MLQLPIFFWLACLASIHVTSASSHRYSHASVVTRDNASGVPLRILPLGDSITWGEKSSHGNGYRQRLQQKLLATHEVEYIGSVRHGTMKNNHTEGHRGFPIGAIRDMGKKRYHERPNVVLVMAGTNDVVFNFSPSKAHVAMGKLINEILEACPDAVVLVATLPPLLLNDVKSQQIKDINTKLPEVIDRYTRTEKHVALVDMSDITSEHIHSDKIHPLDGGYEIMAENWYAGILAAEKNGWIKAPLSWNSTNTTSNTSGSYNQTETSSESVQIPSPAAKTKSKEPWWEERPSATVGSIGEQTSNDHSTNEDMEESQSTSISASEQTTEPTADALPEPEHSQGQDEQSNSETLQDTTKQDDGAQSSEADHPEYLPPSDKQGPKPVTPVNEPVILESDNVGYSRLYIMITGLAIILFLLFGRKLVFAGARRYRPIPQ